MSENLTYSTIDFSDLLHTSFVFDLRLFKNTKNFKIYFWRTYDQHKLPLCEKHKWTMFQFTGRYTWDLVIDADLISFVTL